MQIVTLFFSIIGSIFIFYLQPIHSLIVFIIGLTWYPQPLTVSIASIDFSLSRILILSVLIKIFTQTNLVKNFKWHITDTFMVLYMLVRLIALSQNVPIRIFIEREGGGFIDSFLPYFASRLIINSKSKLQEFIRLIVIVSIPVGLLGVYQCVTGNNPLGFLSKYYSWGLASDTSTMYSRHGFYRASSSFGSLGAYGLFFSALTILSISTWKYRIWTKNKNIIYSILMFLGTLASMSSAPLFSIVVAVFLLACFPFRRLWPVLVIVFITWILSIEFYSNRHWYEVLTRFAFSSHTAYYRIELIKEAFGGGMDGHWLFGYGYVGVGPGNNNSNFHWVHIDIVNIYLAILIRVGIAGLIPFLGVNFLYYRNLFVAGKKALTLNNLWLIWCIMAIFGGWNVAMMTIAALGQVNTLMHILIGISANLSMNILNKSDS